MTYDIVVIGGGPGGYQSALEAEACGYSVALVEKESLGGTCLHRGCIPTKTLLHSSVLFRRIQEAEQYGIHTGHSDLLLPLIEERKKRIVSALHKGLVSKLKKERIDIFRHTARIESLENGARIVLDDGTYICGRYLIIASGSRPFFPDIHGLADAFADGFAVDSSGFLNDTSAYAKAVVIGSGVAGIELAGFLSDVGTEVTVLDSRKEILKEMDSDVKKVFLRSLAEKGVKFRLGADVLEVDAGNRTVKIREDKEESIRCDKVIVCTGRIPDIQETGAAKAGIAVEGGRIVVDDYCRTNFGHVYAVGDVNGKVMLAHAAYAEARTAVRHIMGEMQGVEYQLIPKVIYTHPEAAWVGETEKNPGQESAEYVSASCSMKYSGKFMIENEKEHGVCKLVWEKKTGRLKGCFLVGDNASELIITAENMIRDEKTAEDIMQMIFPHPSVGEVLQECTYMAWEGKYAGIDLGGRNGKTDGQVYGKRHEMHGEGCRENVAGMDSRRSEGSRY